MGGIGPVQRKIDRVVAETASAFRHCARVEITRERQRKFGERKRRLRGRPAGEVLAQLSHTAYDRRVRIIGREKRILDGPVGQAGVNSPVDNVRRRRYCEQTAEQQQY